MLDENFQAHLSTGLTTLARCWRLSRRDGLELGFTDHDRDITFAGVTFKADTGLTARALAQTTGLSVDNTEALGALSDVAVTEADIAAGRYDGARIEAWLVNWAAPEQRLMQFRGNLGEITRAAGGFRAELLGLAERLNRPQGRAYQTACSAVLGDGDCRVDLSGPGFSGEGVVETAEDQKLFTLSGLQGFDDRWFERGRLSVLSGAAVGLIGVIKNDRPEAAVRGVELWQSLRAAIAPGDRVRLEAGCDKRTRTCRLKFDNMLNYRGFPNIPGEDRMLSVPVGAQSTAGGK
jgi:uncharacterized phage protein (TIGR02218 family)